MKKFSFVFISVNVYALMFGIVFMPHLAIGQIAAWDFSGQNNLTTFAATTFSANLISSSGANEITRGSTATPSSTANSFRTTGFKDDGISTSNTDYFQITLQAASSYKVSLSTIDANFGGTGSFFASPGVTSQFAYSLDGTNFTLIGSPVQTISLAMTQISLTGITDLQNVVSGTTITIRYYASGQTSTGGWGFLSAASLGTKGLAIGGTIEALPTPTKLVITNITPTSPTVGSGFNVTVQAQEGSGNPSNVVAATDFSFTTNGAAGSISGTTTGTINTGSNTVTIAGVTLSTIGTGATIIATRTGGDNLTTATSTPFNVLAAATHLAFAGVPSTSATATNLTSFIVKALRPDNSIDDTYTGNIVVSKATGSGALSGTTTKAAVAGVATFDDLQFDAADSYTINANSGSFSQITSGTIIITLPTNSSDYFRSNVTTGDWANNSSWESSHDNTTWITATLAPTSDANIITIRNQHTITIAATATIDQVVIESGGILSYTAGTLTINDDATGHDIIIQNGGVFSHNPSSALLPVFSPTTASINIQAGGMIEALTNSGPAANYASDAGNAAFQTSMVWDNGSIFKWNNSSFPATSGRTFFPKVNTSTIPILRVNNGWTTVGGASQTTINGKLEVNSSISWGTSAGTKTFRNGIIGTATMTQSTSGQWVISGTTADLGGGVTLSLGTNGLAVNSGVTLSSTGTLTLTGTGTLSLAENATLNSLVLNGSGVSVADATTLTVSNTLTLTSGKITLGTGNVVAATISGGDASSYVITGGTGTLKRTSVGVTAVTFPIGTVSDYLPITSFSNSGTSDDFSAKVSAAAPSCVSALNTLTATWDISEAVATGSVVSMTVQYNTATGRGGSFANGSAKLFHCNGGTPDKWGNAGASGANPFTISASGFTSFSPFGVSSDAVLPVESLNFQAKSANGKTLTQWTTAIETNNAYFDIQHATDAKTFQNIGQVKGNGTTNAQNSYAFEHSTPSVGTNYYRLRQVDFDGKQTLSNIVSVLNNNGGKLKVYPTIATDNIIIRSEHNEPQIFNIYNLLGQNVQTGQLVGQKELIISQLATGTYIVKMQGETVKFMKN